MDVCKVHGRRIWGFRVWDIAIIVVRINANTTVQTHVPSKIMIGADQHIIAFQYADGCKHIRTLFMRA